MRTVPGKIKKGFVTYKTPIIYASSSITKAVATLIAGFFIAKFISPEDLGLWSTLSLFITYALFLQGGVINGLNLELPLSFGEGKNKRGRLMVSVTQTFTLYISSAFFVIGFMLYLFFPFENIKIKFGVLAVSCIIVLTFYQNHLLSTFRSNNSFLKLSYLQIIDAFVNIITIFLVLYFSYYGLLLKAVIVIIIFVALLHINRPIKVSLKWDRKVFFNLAKVGFPIFILAYIESLALTFDKLILIKYTDLKSVGFYSFALYALAFSTLFANSIASYIYPKMSYQYGKDKNTLILWKYVKKITVLLFIIQLPLFVIGYFVIPIVVTDYFPNYIESIIPMQILLLAGIMKGSVIGVNVIWSMKKWKYMIIYQVLYSVLVVVLTFLFLKLFDDKIIGVSFGILVANTLNLISGIYLSYKATHIA
ncbi:oligosaccharide flippase family protein [Chryseobacterium aahli]|uniref:oligosaccharide flippase family protein n=1 Tax=Chryseobacterium aahli TaxID=1278643 RepID=UPI001F60CFB7|nr:oligosaccharide flippase family protein [Chryseobacterium aahli]MCI3936816.1 oligosaccharide flippase family protein [Chryseobacterium aahli]